MGKTSKEAHFVGGPRRGSEATKQGVGGGIVCHDRDFFLNQSIQVAFVEHLKQFSRELK